MNFLTKLQSKRGSQEEQSSSNVNQEETISISGNPSKNKYACNSVHETSAVFSLGAKEIDFEQRKRKPLDLAIVLDKSGSMSGEKLSMCKETVKFLLGQLQDDDKCALIAFDTNIEAHPFQKMTEEGKRTLDSTVDCVNAGSATNLSGGLFKAAEMMMELKIQNDANEVQSILLLTDGMANVGISDTDLLIHELQTQISDMPALSIFTFGYGADHNDDMLRAISDQGSGMYYYVEDEESISVAFGSCLGGLLSVVAQNISMSFETGDGSVSIEKVCTKSKVERMEERSGFSTTVGDIFAGEKKDVVLKLKLEPVAEQCVMQAVVCQIDYFDVILESARSFQLILEVVRSENDEDVIHNLEVIAATNRIIAAESMDEATKIAKEGRLTMERGWKRTTNMNLNRRGMTSQRKPAKKNKKSNSWIPKFAQSFLQSSNSSAPPPSLAFQPPPQTDNKINKDTMTEDDPLSRARGVLEQGIEQISNTFTLLQGSEYLEAAKILVEDLEKCKESLRDQDSYMLEGKNLMNCAAQGHWKQRHNLSKLSSSNTRKKEMYQTVCSYGMQEQADQHVRGKMLKKKF